MKKIGISSKGEDLDSQVDLYFGGSQYICVIEWDEVNGKIIDYEVMQNDLAQPYSGVSIAQALANEGIEALVTGHIGFGAFGNLQQEGIDIYLATAGKVGDTAEDYFNGNLAQLIAPNPLGRGGQGRGRGQGQGKGMGRGQGGGQGRGGGKNQP